MYEDKINVYKSMLKTLLFMIKFLLQVFILPGIGKCLARNKENYPEKERNVDDNSNVT